MQKRYRVHVAIKRMRRRETSLQKPACNHGFLFNDLYFLQLQTRVNTWCKKIGRNFVFMRFLAFTNMPNSVEQSSKSKKNKFDNFIWSDDEVELLLNVVLEYKTARTMVNIDWETCQTKYVDILDLFRAQCLLLVIKQTRANACLFNARDTLLTVAWFRVFTSLFLYLRGFVVHTKTIFTRANIFTL